MKNLSFAVALLLNLTSIEGHQLSSDGYYHHPSQNYYGMSQQQQHQMQLERINQREMMHEQMEQQHRFTRNLHQ